METIATKEEYKCTGLRLNVYPDPDQDGDEVQLVADLIATIMEDDGFTREVTVCVPGVYDNDLPTFVIHRIALEALHCIDELRSEGVTISEDSFHALLCQAIAAYLQ